jgi:2-oxoglutarate dehydrogenase E2 component (dihydrolipoamide succinyltransferase)
MIVELKIPSPGESITEVEISTWFVSNGDYVEKDQELGEIESDKATLPLIAEESGTITILIEAGTSVQVGSVACKIDTSASAPKEKTKKEKAAEHQDSEKVAEKATEEKSPEKEKTSKESPDEKKEFPDVKVSPVAKQMMKEHGVSVEDIISGLKRIGKKEVEIALGSGTKSGSGFTKKPDFTREVARNKMSSLRKKISERLVSVKNETAMLTTFNEVDMTAVMELRKKYQNQFVEKHGIKLGFMSFFTRAATEALKLYPMVNSFIENDEIITPAYYDIGIAVQTDKGLMVPVMRNTETMSLADMEKNIAELAEKARKNRISLDDLTGGTFTITNGGIFGSLMSTPILNPPQSGILGMHNIVERPVVIAGKIEIRPMMYIALSYDHRVIDGRDSVGFLVKIKEFIESPEKMLLGGTEPGKLLLEI